MVHELKILPVFFDAVAYGIKTFEIRDNTGRGFRGGDTVILREWLDDAREYTGRNLRAHIGYVTAYEQKPGYVVFSLLHVEGGRR